MVEDFEMRKIYKIPKWYSIYIDWKFGLPKHGFASLVCLKLNADLYIDIYVYMNGYININCIVIYWFINVNHNGWASVTLAEPSVKIIESMLQ
jgi:hypothetical protein